MPCLKKHIFGDFQRRREESKCRHLVADTWHRYLLRRQASLGATLEQMLYVNGEFLEVWCVPFATHVTCIDKMYQFHAIRFFVIYILKLLCSYNTIWKFGRTHARTHTHTHTHTEIIESCQNHLIETTPMYYSKLLYNSKQTTRQESVVSVTV